jgi:hypothetical protein
VTRERLISSGELKVAMARLVRETNAPDWQVVQRLVSRKEIIQAADMLKEGARAERVLEPLREAHTLLWTPAWTSNGHVALHAHRFDDEAGARRYHEFAMELLRRQDEFWSKPGGLLCVHESRFSTLPAHANLGQAVRADKRMKTAQCAEPVQVTTFLVRRADLCLEITWHGLPVDESWTLSALRAVLPGESIRPAIPE